MRGPSLPLTYTGSLTLMAVQSFFPSLAASFCVKPVTAGTAIKASTRILVPIVRYPKGLRERTPKERRGTSCEHDAILHFSEYFAAENSASLEARCDC